MEVASCVQEALHEIDPRLEVRCVPIADGGEGSLDAIASALGGTLVEKRVTGPNFQEVHAKYLWYEDTAFIETASASGLTLALPGSTPMKTTSFGTGELMLDALSRRAKTICLCLGGSATNDGATGIAAALGCRFYHGDKELFPVGGTLGEIDRIDASEMKKCLGDTKIQALVDVDNPLLGPNGASYVYAKQKGASEKEVELLEAGMANLSKRFQEDLGIDVSMLRGAGAAGGIGGGAVALFGAELVSGIHTLLDYIEFDNLAKESDLIITGEGKLDSQSAQGKVASGIASKAKESGKPCVLVVGKNDLKPAEWKAFGVLDVIETNPHYSPEQTLTECKNKIKSAVLRRFKELL